jgi:hypothetical protein
MYTSQGPAGQVVRVLRVWEVYAQLTSGALERTITAFFTIKASLMTMVLLPEGWRMTVTLSAILAYISIGVLG